MNRPVHPRCRLPGRRAAPARFVLALALGVPAQGQAQVLPSGGSVVAGSAAIVSGGGASAVIVQQSRKAIINWQSFSVGAGASVTFRQPDPAAITLNRVTGAGASVLDGNLAANGQVWLVNGNGILMGQGSRIDVGGLIATTSDIADPDFLSGRYAFDKPSANRDAAVINRGSIKAATGGSAVLSGARVANDGMIQARLGHVVLGGANAFSVAFDGDNLLQYQITTPILETPKDGDGKPASALVSNAGTIAAQGGQVLMTARAARNVVDNVINSSGIIQARSASLRNGEVILDAGADGAVTVGGAVDVSGRQAGETGGTIALLGDKVAVADGARLDSSGALGGGRILIGGNLHGAGPEPNAQSASVGKAVITADATAGGQGGTVAVYSTGKTSVAASISAKGVAAGGVVETSGHDLNIEGTARVDTSAAAGPAGLWLLDPVDIDVDPAFAANVVASIAGTNVSLVASNDINVNAPIVYASANSLTFLAGHNLTINADVQNGGAGAILAVAGWDGVTLGSGIFTTPGAYGNAGGSVLIGGIAAADAVALGSRNGATTVAAWDLTIAARNGHAQLGYNDPYSTSIVTQGSITVALDGQLTLTGGDTVSGSFAQIGHGRFDVTGSLSGNIAIAAQGPVSLAGGAAFHANALIGNGGPQSVGIASGNVLIASGGDFALGTGSLLSAGGTGDALVVAASGNFTNQAGSAALNVSGGGRWLFFLNGPANNTQAGLIAAPFYNRAFDFSTNSFAAVAGAGNRFVYTLAPVVTVTAGSATKVYGTANPALSVTIAGGLPGDSPAGVYSGAPSLGTVATASSAAGSYPVVAALGTLQSDYNYGFQFVNGTLQVDPATLSAALTGTVRKVYDATATATLTAANFQLTGILFNDQVTVSAAAGSVYDSANVGMAKTVSASGLTLSGAAKGNYVLAATNLSASIGVIDPALLTAALTGTVRKAYNGTAAATLTPANYQLTGVLSGEQVTLNGPAGGVYDSANVGTAKTVSVSGLTLSGADSGNYILAAANLSAGIGVIDPALLTAALTGMVRKVYDGTAAATLTPANYQLAGVLSVEQVILNGPAGGAYDSANVGTAKTVSAVGLTLSGADSGNYVLASSSISASLGEIDPLTLTASLTGTVQKVFDGTAAAFLDASNYDLAGVRPGDSVILNNFAAGAYDDETVGTGKTVTVSGLALAGADGGNYVLAAPGISGAVGIIITPPVGVLGNSYTSNAVTNTPQGLSRPSSGANGAAPGASDATSDTGGTDGESAQGDSAAFELGKSLSGATQSSTSVLIGGLLRQFSPPPGGTTVRGVPPYGQIYSSWGNEAFWQ